LFVRKVNLDCFIDNDYHLYMKNPQPPASARPADEFRRVSSEALLGVAKALVILHNGREYRLRLTQNGKLILTA
jgi:hemin uptake protein HemP